MQGERQFAKDSKTIGRFNLDDIPPAGRGVPQIEVSFDIDVNGILHVSAKNLGTGKEQKITITASSGLSKDEIEKMRKDGELHADEDRENKEALETRNEGESAVYRTEKMMKDNAAKLSADSKGKLETAASAVKEALKGTDVAAIKAASERLNETWQAVSTELYQAADKTHAGKGPGDDQSGKQPEAEDHHEENQKSEEPVIDAEVVDEHQPA